MRQDVMTTVQMLARYLRAHPHVCDTAEGIAHWWLLDLAPPPVVEEAIDWMIGRGVLETLPAADGRTRLRRVADPTLDARLEALAEGLDEPPPRSLH